MITIHKVVQGGSGAGDATALQPAASLSPEVKQQLFDEFTNTTPAPAAPVGGQTIFFAVVLATGLAIAALYVIKHIKTDELRKFADKK